MNLLFESIADGLAEHGYAVADNFINDEQVQNILNLKEFKTGLEHFKKAGIGKQQAHQINEAVRGDYIHWVDKSLAAPSLVVYLEKLQALIEYLNAALYLSLKDYELHMTVYPPGTYYKRHLDQFNRDDHRKISVICYLNDSWKETEGGHLRMYLAEKTLDVSPIAGRLVCFRSDQIEHEVLPASRARLSITGWILDQHIGLKHL